MGLLIATLFLVLFLLLAGTVLAVVLMLEDTPAIPGAGLDAADLREARVFIENRDPRRLAPGELSAFTISEQDLQLLLNYLLDHLDGGSSLVELDTGSAELRLSARLPANPLGDYLNLRIALSQDADMLALESLQIGGLTAPGWLANPLMQQTHALLLERVPEYNAAIAAIDSYSIDAGRLNISYQWQPQLLEQLSNRGRELFVSDVDRDRLLAHSRYLDELLANPELPARVPVIALLSPMLGFARDRRGDPVEENRAALLVLALYVTGTRVGPLLGEADAVPAPGFRDLVLSRREDFARHFLISAGLAVSAGTGVAQAIGLSKEVDDSQNGGSGFSFTDIGADRTGIRFAELAVAGAAEARAVQDQLAGNPDEGLFMADFRDLPEFLSEADFRQAYGGIGEPAYEVVLTDIEARIGRMPVFSALPP